MQRTRTIATAALLAGAATVGLSGVASAHESPGGHGGDADGGRTGLVGGVAEGAGGLVGGTLETVGNVLGPDVLGPLLDGVL